jgi:two-component system, OmpR family, response regulator
VIIADDDATTTTLIAALLRKHQVKSVIARDGGEAIQAINQSHAQAMVLDVNMPKLDGFEVLQAIRQGAAVAPIKVAMLTSRQQETDIVRAFGLGADDYVVKPFNPLELVSRIKRLLRN